MKERQILIKRVIKGSIAEEAGIEKGDLLLKINDNKVSDIIEYRYLTSDEYLVLLVRKENGEEWEIEVEKDYYEDLGIEFDESIMDEPKRCHNKCMFCFIDQLPSGMRESLYFKDDDSRMSFLQGNFITLTNMRDDDIERIIRYRISPINVSVHTTNPELRIRMLNNKRAGNIMERLEKLVSGGISINCQIVLCPGINDGEELKRTIKDLQKFYPKISNLAVVPVGITKFRDNIYKLQGYDKKSSLEVIKLVKPMQEQFIQKNGEPFVRLADEFYVMAGTELPPLEHYGDFEQLEDGIGMIRFFEHTIGEDLKGIDCKGRGENIAFITGQSSFDFMRKTAKEIGQKLNINISVYKILNNFFGEKITVAGLITGRDILDQLKGVLKEKVVLIPGNMLKADEDIFLDDLTLRQVEKELGIKFIKSIYTGEDLVDNIVNEVIKCPNQ